MTTLKFEVSGMSCGGCANSVRALLSQQFDVDKDRVEVSFEDGAASVKLDSKPVPGRVQSALLALKEQDFPSSLVSGLG